jgi:hypothetical protein
LHKINISFENSIYINAVSLPFFNPAGVDTQTPIYTMDVTMDIGL